MELKIDKWNVDVVDDSIVYSAANHTQLYPMKLQISIHIICNIYIACFVPISGNPTR